jgi:hypothetical protein
MQFRDCATVIGAVMAASSVFGCSHHSTIHNDADLPHFNDIGSAPAKLQTAARAVVRVSTAREIATGVFISPTGLLLTNNHVLGVTVCPVEGCYLQLTFMHQRGAPRQSPVVAFAVPTAADVGLDMAVVQVYTGAGGTPLDTPDCLTLAARDPGSLLGQHVTVIGHPEGNLKKWTDGEIVDADGDWFQTTAYTLPGDSGSPVLDDDGNIVGLIHRGVTGEDLFTTNGANVSSLGTASGPLLTAMSAPLPATMLSVTAETTEADAVANNLVYLNARVSGVPINGVVTPLLDLLGRSCDTGLARQDFKTPGDLSVALWPCDDAMTWIECRSDLTSPSYGTVCPSDTSAWSARFQSVNQRSQEMNGQLDLYAVSFAIARLASSKAAGTASGAQTLRQVVSGAAPWLDFTLANYLVAFGIMEYAGTNLSDYTRNYQKVEHYELQAYGIANTLTWLYGYGSWTREAVLSALAGLQDDPNLGVGAKLYIEDIRYSWDGL